MIKMSLDKETVKVSPAFPAAPVSLSEQPQLAKTHPLRPKNGFQAPGSSQTSLAAAPTQRIAKRRYSMGVGFKGLTKRRRRANSDSQSESILPSHFLLGGNIFDPLNLNSLMDEDINRANNQETPKCSPLPSRGGDPVEILVPRDITDPLNLKGRRGAGGEGGGILLSPLKSRKRHRNRGGGVPARLFPPTARLTVPVVTREGSVPVSPLPCELNTAITCRDDVVPPPILPRRHTHPPPGHAHKFGNQGDGRQRRRRRTTSTRSADAVAANIFTIATTVQPTKFQTPLVGGARANRCGGPQPNSAQPPQKKKDKHRYQYGNHSRYYGYHGSYGDGWEGRVGAVEDPRLRLLEADWFRDKKVLDVGCGAGHLTLAVARSFNPAHILGVELDERLVHAANQNVRHFLSHDLVEEEKRRGMTVPSFLSSSTSSPPRTEAGRTQEEEEKKKEEEEKKEEVIKKEEEENKKKEEMETTENEEQEKKKEVIKEEEKKKKEEMETTENEEQEKKKEVIKEEEKKKKEEKETKEEEEEKKKKEEKETKEDEEEEKKMEVIKEEEEKKKEETKEDEEEEKEEVIKEKKKEDDEDVMMEFQQAVSLLSFPLSFRMSRGPLAAPPLLLPASSSSSSSSSCRFPSNITFIQGDYVSEREAWPGQGQYDVIMCLGVTKWVQLQSGDGGVIRLFRRAYQSLSPGGLFILEPQPWSRYSHSKRASETTYRNYRSVRLRPEQFTCYLTDSVGFTSYRLITHTGNQRPVYLFHKGSAQRK